MTICEAIAREEGFGVPGGRATRNNNPGDINYGKFAIAHGATRLEIIPPGLSSTPRFAYFPTVEMGFAAMRDLLSAHYGGMTIEQMLNKYAPPADNNNTSSYIKNVCTWTGLTPDTIIDQYL
jgi:hypothetical protein